MRTRSIHQEYVGQFNDQGKMKVLWTETIKPCKDIPYKALFDAI